MKERGAGEGDGREGREREEEELHGEEEHRKVKTQGPEGARRREAWKKVG